jgi:alpha-glucuronidase
VGFERTPSGSNATGQYFPEVRKAFESIQSCPENLLLWFHHVPWTYKTRSGRTLWEEMCFRYNSGVDSVRWMQQEWEKSRGMIDDERFEKVSALLKEQEKNARIWKDACLLYFQSINNLPLPENYEKPEHSLDYYMKIRYRNDGRIIN